MPGCIGPGPTIGPSTVGVAGTTAPALSVDTHSAAPAMSQATAPALHCLTAITLVSSVLARRRIVLPHRTIGVLCFLLVLRDHPLADGCVVLQVPTAMEVGGLVCAARAAIDRGLREGAQ